jgi:hypothetical protein
MQNGQWTMENEGGEHRSNIFHYQLSIFHCSSVSPLLTRLVYRKLVHTRVSARTAAIRNEKVLLRLERERVEIRVAVEIILMLGPL